MGMRGIHYKAGRRVIDEWRSRIGGQGTMATIQDALAIGWKLFQAGDSHAPFRFTARSSRSTRTVTAAWQMIAAIDQLEGGIDEAVTNYRASPQARSRPRGGTQQPGSRAPCARQDREAIDCLQRALAAKPDYADAHSNLGNALQEQGHLEQAVASYRRASSSIQPTSTLTTTWEMRFARRESWPNRWRLMSERCRSSRTIRKSG